MVLVYLLGWWYSRGWGWAVTSILKKLKDINESFSIPILLRTWFAPWKQIQTQATFRNFFQAAIDNLVSRFVGSMVRSAMIFMAIFASIFTVSFAVFMVIFWPLVPLLVIVLPVLSVSGGL